MICINALFRGIRRRRDGSLSENDSRFLALYPLDVGRVAREYLEYISIHFAASPYDEIEILAA